MYTIWRETYKINIFAINSKNLARCVRVLVCVSTNREPKRERANKKDIVKDTIVHVMAKMAKMARTESLLYSPLRCLVYLFCCMFVLLKRKANKWIYISKWILFAVPFKCKLQTANKHLRRQELNIGWFSIRHSIDGLPKVKVILQGEGSLRPRSFPNQLTQKIVTWPHLGSWENLIAKCQVLYMYSLRTYTYILASACAGSYVLWSVKVSTARKTFTNFFLGRPRKKGKIKCWQAKTEPAQQSTHRSIKTQKETKNRNWQQKQQEQLQRPKKDSRTRRWMRNICSCDRQATDEVKLSGHEHR